jgi:hypothetical protein
MNSLGRLPLGLFAAGLLVFVALLSAAPANPAVGVEKTSRLAGVPGAKVDLTLACGFCFPPCTGPPGHREPSPCMLGTHHAQPPESFAISLVPIAKAPKPHWCGPNALCSPTPKGAPRHAPYTYLGQATPPADGEGPSDGKNIPRYLLDFAIPDLAPGVYTYVIFCDACARGERGSLIASPSSRLWRLRVVSSPRATIGQRSSSHLAYP